MIHAADDTSTFVLSPAAQAREQDPGTRFLSALKSIASRSAAPDLSEQDWVRTAAEAMGVTLWVWDLVAGTLVWTNQPESSPSRATGEWLQRIHPDDREAVLHRLEGALRSDRNVYENRFRLLDERGRYVHVKLRAVIHRDADQQPVRLVGSTTNITEEVETQNRMREQSELLGQASDAIILRSLDGQVRYWSPGAERVYGWAAAEALGKNVSSLVYLNQEQFKIWNRELLERGSWEGETEHLTKDRRHVPVRCRWALLRNEAGIPHAVLSINTDISDRKKLESQLLRAQRLENVAMLASAIAHDLNNLLTPITIASGVIHRLEVEPATHELLKSVETSAERGANLIRQILSLSRERDHQASGVDLGFIVKEIEQLTATTFPKSIRVRRKVQKDLWPVKGTIVQLHQVLLNLCLNARDAMPNGGDLLLEADNRVIDAAYAQMQPDASPGRYVVLSVRDTGTGIPEEIRDRIFEPLFTTKACTVGTGLGLPTVKSIVRGHRGWVEVSTQINAGSTFRVFIPAEVSPSQNELPATPSEVARGRGEHVLIVDDETAIRTITGYALESHGYRVTLASDGAEALVLYARDPSAYDVVLTDLNMPTLDGLSLTQALSRFGPATKWVVAAGRLDPSAVERLRNLGVTQFLQKPFTADRLFAAIHETLASARRAK